MIASARNPLTYDPTVLERVLARVRALPGAVVVFDLDSTLLDNKPRQARILREFGAARGIPALAAARSEHWVDWSIQHAMANAGLGSDEIARLAEDAKQFWRDRFFTSEYCRDDEPIAGAHEYLDAVVEAGGFIAYCTGRHEQMRAGTVENFTRLGYPVPGPRALRRRLEDRSLRALARHRRRRRGLRQRADPRQRLPRRLPRGHRRAPGHRRLRPQRPTRRRGRQHQGFPPLTRASEQEIFGRA
jgi:hypothetical protein